MKSARIFFLFLVVPIFGFAQDLVKVWEIDSFHVSLYRYEQIRITPIYSIENNVRNYGYQYEIRRGSNLVNTSGGLRVNADSCVLSFLELPSSRLKNGYVGNYYEINLCTRTLKQVPVVKPSFNLTTIDSVIITPLDSIIENPYNPQLPHTVKGFDGGKSRKLHPKMVESFLVFYQDMYLSARYIENEFVAPYLPNFKLTIYSPHGKSEVLMYYNRYIVDGYIYGSGGGEAPFELKIWDANIEFWQRD